MKAKAMLLIGGVAGYVLGTRDGRQRYEQIKAQTDKLWSNPKLQDARIQAEAQLKDAAGKATEAAKAKLGDQPDGGAHV